jgi:sodium/hydrogen antiporter
MKWSLAIVALAVLVVAAASRRLSGTPVTAAMVFVVIGVLVGPAVADQVGPATNGETVRTLAEGTLAVVLFTDASRIRLDALRREYVVPLRLLGIGLPLTIAFGTVLGAIVFHQLTIAEALVLAVLLAPTDAALGQAVVSDPRLPSRIRQGLNVESGLNDGICVPLLFIVLAAADIESHVAGAHHAVVIVAEEIGYGILGGAGAGLLLSAVVKIGRRHDLIANSWLQIIPVAGAALAYGVAAALGGSGFIAAFLAGMLFGALGDEPDETFRFSEGLGSVLDGLTFLAFGAVLLGPALSDLSWCIVLYAVLSLTVVRMLPVALALIGTGHGGRHPPFSAGSDRGAWLRSSSR